MLLFHEADSIETDITSSLLLSCSCVAATAHLQSLKTAALSLAALKHTQSPLIVRDS